MLTSEQQKIYNVTIPKGGYGYYTLYHGIYDPAKGIDERPVYAQTGDKFEPEGSSVVYKATRKNGKTTWAIDEDAQRQSESGEGGGGSSLPSMTGKNGKVLGVTLDAQDHEQAEWVTPSGGGAEKFVVTLTKENDTWTADKTVAEIVAADAANQVVVAKYPGDGIYVELPISAAVSSQGMSAAAFAGLDGREQGSGYIISVICMNQGSEDVIQTEITRIPAALPDYSSSNNGQVLGVDDGDIAWVDSNAPLIVTMTEDQQNPGTYGGDKTIGEIKTAFEAGRNVVCIIPALNASVSVIQVAVDNSDIEISTGNKDVTFIGAANDYPSITT